MDLSRFKETCEKYGYVTQRLSGVHTRVSYLYKDPVIGFKHEIRIGVVSDKEIARYEEENLVPKLLGYKMKKELNIPSSVHYLLGYLADGPFL